MKRLSWMLLLLAGSWVVSCKSAGPPPSATPPPAAQMNPAETPAPPAPAVAPVPPSPATATPPGYPPPPPPAAAVPPQASMPDASSRPYQDVIRLKQSGLSDEFLLNKIRTENVSYQLTTSEILDLRAAGISEVVVEAMMRSGQPAATLAGAPIARRAEFSGLARVGKGFLVFGTSAKNTGRLVVDGDKISWYDSENPKKNFSVYTKAVKEIFNTCVLRPEQNLCLEFGLVTYTGEEYRFREPGWKKGDNRAVTEATNYFRQAFPGLFFSQRAVNEM